MLLEAAKHEASAFVTLTYSDDFCPPDGSLRPKEAQDWLKRFRRAVAPVRVRFYLVGEYGEQSQRPHYHAALFGVSGCAYLLRDAAERARCQCSPCVLLRNSWGRGKTDNAFLEPESAAYLAGYVTKKLTNGHDPVAVEFLKGRHPEFARMSLKPGIGASAMDDVADLLTTDFGCEVLGREYDVPAVLTHGKKTMPLGRYLKGKLREKMGPVETFKELAAHKFALRMRQLFEEDKAVAKAKGQKVGEYASQVREQKARNVEARYKIWSKKKGSL